MQAKYIEFRNKLAFIKVNQTTHIILILTILTLIGCDNKGKKPEHQNNRLELVPEPDRDLREEYEQKQKDEFDTINIKGIDCNQFSKQMTDLKKLLEKDNYKVEINDQRNGLWFRSEKENDEFEIDKSISYAESQCLAFYVKRKTKLKGKKDNWYPSFSVTEICFEDEISASKNYQEISNIINNGDFFNDKNYDYILINGHRLIYVSCGAKIFEEYAFSYKGKIEDLIKNKR